MTRYFYDTEFLEDGKTIDLISIGIVAEDGREFYAVNADMPIERIREDTWLMKNVVPQLPLAREPRRLSPELWLFCLDLTNAAVKPRWVIRNEVREFLLSDPSFTDLWADHAAYDHVVLAQLFGKMIDLPDGIPEYTHEFQQEVSHDLDAPELPEQESGLHNSLADARHLKACFEYLKGLSS
ncbi:3'-5' exoribonuclease [Rhodococcus marinonascens]|uniref:3'-5' exoribonuclease n=1 Tax=Rhodococcus marinonascens TaxID=38311 RepID=UPI000933F0AF|nr:3'-5' exoribonuclease [Rhodococcus marinonascens]